MFHKKIISGITIASTILVLTGCSTAGLNNVNPNPNNPGPVTQSPINDLKFSKVSDQKKSEYSTLITQNAVSATESAKSGVSSPTVNSTVALAPMVATAGNAKMSTGISGGGGAYPMMYFPQPGMFEEYVVTDFEEAKTAGFSGTYLNALKTIVRPVMVKIGSDFRMVNSNGSSDDSGVNQSQLVNNNVGKPNMPIASPVYNSPYQWQFTFVSSSKKEIYNIFVSSTETLVLRQKWGIKDLNPDDIKIDSSDAINLVKKAVSNKNFTSPDNQQNYMDPAAEILYELPKDATWYLYLEKDKGKLVWNLNMNYNNNMIAYSMDDSAGVSASGTTAPGKPTIITNSNDGGSTTSSSPAMMPPAYPQYWYSGGYARVDASTGEIISLNRPSRYKNVNPVQPPCCKEEVLPMPAVDQKPPVTK